MRVAWIGTADDHSEEMTHRGIVFKRGKFVTVPDDHAFADDFRENPTFTTKAATAKEAAAEEAEAERAMLVEELTKRDVQFGDKATNEELQKLYDDALLAEAKA